MKQAFPGSYRWMKVKNSVLAVLIDMVLHNRNDFVHCSGVSVELFLERMYLHAADVPGQRLFRRSEGVLQATLVPVKANSLRESLLNCRVPIYQVQECIIPGSTVMTRSTRNPDDVRQVESLRQTGNIITVKAVRLLEVLWRIDGSELKRIHVLVLGGALSLERAFPSNNDGCRDGYSQHRHRNSRAEVVPVAELLHACCPAAKAQGGNNTCYASSDPFH